MSRDGPPPARGSHAWWCRQVIDATADGVVVADDAGVIRVWNHGATALLGHGAEDAIGRRLDLIIPGTYQEAHRAGFAGAMRTGARQGVGHYVVFPALHLDGRIVQVAASLTILRDPLSGATAGAAVIMRATGARGD